MKRTLLAMVFAMVFMATSVQAADRGYYASVKGGLTIASSIDDLGVDISFDPGFNITAALGYDLGMIRVEGEIGYRIFDFDEITVLGIPGGLSLDGDVSALTFMGNGYYDFDINSAIKPYVGVGLGFADADVEFTIPGLGTVDVGSTEFAYQFMLGAGIEISPGTDLTAGYRYFGIAESFAPDSHEFNVGVRFSF